MAQSEKLLQRQVFCFDGAAGATLRIILGRAAAVFTVKGQEFDYRFICREAQFIAIRAQLILRGASVSFEVMQKLDSQLCASINFDQNKSCKQLVFTCRHYGKNGKISETLFVSPSSSTSQQLLKAMTDWRPENHNKNGGG